MTSNISICGICDLRHLSNLSTHWCQDCDEVLCSECKGYHTLLKATRGHATIQIKDYQKLPSFITGIKQYCDIHNEKYQNYCQKHECPICCKCIQDHAKYTENIVHIETVIKHAKTSQTFQDFNQCISDLQSNITRMMAARKDNLAKVADQCKSAVKKIREFRIKLNHHLDVVEKDLIIKLQDAESKSSQQIKEVIQCLSEAESEISNFDNILQGIKQHASELQVYLATREIGKQVSYKETRLTSLMKNKRFDDLSVSLEIDTNIANILYDVKVFGTVSMETVPTNYKLINVKSRQAQIITTVVKFFDDIKLTQVNKFDSFSRQVTGCIILPDGRIAFTEYGYNRRLSIRKADGSPDFEIPFKESTAFNLTLVKDATVSCGNHSGNTTCIKIIDLKSREITQIVNTSNIAYWIACVDELLVYCGYKPNGIYAFDVKTEQQTKISSTINVGIMSYITYFKNKFYVTDGTNHTVTSFDNKGNIIWTYKDYVNMNTPRGISVDNGGNVFVASAGSNNVTIISPDGISAKQLVDQKNGLDNP